MENIPTKNVLEEAPTEGLFKDLHRGEKMNAIRELVAQNPRLAEYYELTKKVLMDESGLPAIHRGQILNRMYEILSNGGDAERELAKQLEKIAKVS
jgi:hypothetical protein